MSQSTISLLAEGFFICVLLGVANATMPKVYNCKIFGARIATVLSGCVGFYIGYRMYVG